MSLGLAIDSKMLEHEEEDGIRTSWLLNEGGQKDEEVEGDASYLCNYKVSLVFLMLLYLKAIT